MIVIDLLTFHYFFLNCLDKTDIEKISVLFEMPTSVVSSKYKVL